MIDDLPDMDVMTLIKFCVLLVIGVIIISAVSGNSLNPTPNAVATGVISLTNQPVDGDTITVDGTVYEFDNGNGVTSGHIPVLIGVSKSATANNLVTEINDHSMRVVAE